MPKKNKKKVTIRVGRSRSRSRARTPAPKSILKVKLATDGKRGPSRPRTSQVRVRANRFTNRTVRAPVSYGRQTRMAAEINQPSIVPGKEYLGDVTGSATSDTSKIYYWNPGDAAIFPWLSTQAAGYHRFKFKKLRLIYEGTCATTEKGDVIMATVPNIDATPMTTKQQFLDTAGMVRSIPWTVDEKNKVVHDVLATGAEKLLLSYNVSKPDGTAPDGIDYNTYEFCFTQVGCFGNSGSVAVGELWVEYVVEFSGRRIASLSTVPGAIPEPVSYDLAGSGTFSSTHPVGTVVAASYSHASGISPTWPVWGKGSDGVVLSQSLYYSPNLCTRERHYRYFRCFAVYTGTGLDDTNGPRWQVYGGNMSIINDATNVHGVMGTTRNFATCTVAMAYYYGSADVTCVMQLGMPGVSTTITAADVLIIEIGTDGIFHAVPDMVFSQLTLPAPPTVRDLRPTFDDVEDDVVRLKTSDLCELPTNPRKQETVEEKKPTVGRGGWLRL